MGPCGQAHGPLPTRRTEKNMELIPREEFGRLRLAQFIPNGAGIEELEDWEYENRIWIGEAIGFTEWLRPERKPDVLGCLSLDLEALPQSVWQQVFDRLRLPLRQGMDFRGVVELLGEPGKVYAFVPEQKTYEFVCGSRARYKVGCTIHDENGLKYVTVIAATRAPGKGV